MLTQETIQFARDHLSSDTWYTDADIAYASAILDTVCQDTANQHTDSNRDIRDLVISLTAATGAVATALQCYKDALNGKLSAQQYKDTIISLANASATTGAVSKQILMELHRKFGEILDETMRD